MIETTKRVGKTTHKITLGVEETQALLNILWGCEWGPTPEGDLAEGLYEKLIASSDMRADRFRTSAALRFDAVAN